MRNVLFPVTSALLLASGGRAEAHPGKRLFMDVHELGPGKVTAADVAHAHQKDLEAQGRHGVTFLRYWVDASAGKIYCLSEAPDSQAIVETHREAHGLLPSAVYQVQAGQEARPKGGKLYLDIHRVGPGKVTADDVAKAHQKDLAAQGSHGVNFLDYWVDEKSGTVICLSEAPDGAVVNDVHREAHGLLADEVLDVVEGR